MDRYEPLTGSGYASQPLKQAEEMIQQAQALQAQSQLTLFGDSNISQQIIKADQQLQKVLQDLQLTSNQVQSQMDAQQRQIARIEQDIVTAIESFRAVDQMVKQRMEAMPLQ